METAGVGQVVDVSKAGRVDHMCEVSSIARQD